VVVGVVAMSVVISHGEMLIDFVSTINGVSLIEAPSFLKTFIRNPRAFEPTLIGDSATQWRRLLQSGDRRSVGDNVAHVKKHSSNIFTKLGATA
jgi:hypothetical protein